MRPMEFLHFHTIDVKGIFYLAEVSILAERSLSHILHLKSSDRNFTVPYDELVPAKENVKLLSF